MGPNKQTKNQIFVLHYPCFEYILVNCSLVISLDVANLKYDHVSKKLKIKKQISLGKTITEINEAI